MGDVVNRREGDAWRGWTAALAITSLVLGFACTSSKPAKVVEAAPAEAARPAADEKPATAAAEIRSLELREGAPEVFVDLESSAPLVWTSFRNADGQVVVELPNALPGAGVSDLAPVEGLVASLQVQRAQEGTRPMTRLVIGTRHEVEHSITAEANRLQVRLQPVGEQAALDQATQATPEPMAAESPAPPAAPGLIDEPAASPAQEAPAEASSPGTLEEPRMAPVTSGEAATRLDGIEVLASQGSSVVRISGDGALPYSTFALAEPERFVIDLNGVINRSARTTVNVEGGIVERVRVAQFKPYPKPVSRVVFDLRSRVVPVIERTSDALVVSFPSGSDAAAEAPISEPARDELRPPERPAPTPPPASDLDLAPRTGTTMLAQRNPSGIEVEEAPAAPPSSAPPQVQITPAGPAPAGGSRREVTPTGASSGTVLETFQPQALGQTEKVYKGELIDLKVTNADVTEVLRTFAQIGGLNMVIQPGVSGQVTAELDNVPWDQALEQILKINGLSYELEGNMMRVAPVSVLRQEAQEKQQLAAAQALSIPLRTILRRLSYADAGEISGLLSGQGGLLSQRGSVIVDARTNSLIVKELPGFIDTVMSVIDRLDTPEPQVMIEARIIETTKRFTRDFGIQWGFEGVADAAHGNTTGLIFPNNINGTGGVNAPGGGNTGSINLRLGNVLNTFQLDIALQAAESEGLINILSAPKVATLNNQQASIQSGLQIPIQTVANNTVTVQYVNATLRLDVTPQVTAEGTVLMTIAITKREPQLAFLVPGATNAPIATKEASTRLLVRDGGTAVIGGIYRVTSDSGEDRVPGLANIPIIGHLFKNKTRSEENEELLIFITPRVIKI